MTRVRIGIVSWNTAELLHGCLAALPAATAGVDADVVVVDNCSSDDSVAVARRHGAVTVIANAENVGYAKAMNQALNAPSPVAPDVLIALNPDTVAPAGSLTALAELLVANPDVGLVVPKLVNTDGTLQHSVYRFPSTLVSFVVCAVPTRFQQGWVGRRFWLEGAAPHNEGGDIDWAIGAVHAIRPDALKGRPPYNERWFMYVEDLDLCYQLSQDGWRVRFAPEVAIMHVGNAAGEKAWGEGRTARWWSATYDWYRFRRGVGAARRWAALNTVTVAILLVTLKGWRRLRGRSAGEAQANALYGRIADLGIALPLHIAMLRDPRHAYTPD
jgi:GT2 family glycosyltransferase